MIASIALLEIQLLVGGVSVDIESHKEAAKLALYVTTTALSQKHKADMRLLAARHNYEVGNYETCATLCQDPEANQHRDMHRMHRVSPAHLKSLHALLSQQAEVKQLL